MTKERKISIIIGSLFLISTTSFLFGDRFVAEVLRNPEYLKNTYPNTQKVALGTILQFINNMAVIGIGLMFLPILRRYNPNAAFGYLITRIVEATLLFVSAICILAIIPLSKQYLQAAAGDLTHFETFGLLLKHMKYKGFQIAMVALGFGSFFLCYVLYQTKLVPRFFSILGFIGYTALLVKVFAELLGYQVGGSILYIPGALFEFLMPLWLLIKGFNASAITSKTPQDEVLA